MLPLEYRSCCLYGCNIMNRFHSSQSGLTAPAGTWLVRSQEGAHCRSSRTRRIKLMGSSVYWALQSSSHLKCSPSLHFPEPFVAARNTKLNKFIDLLTRPLSVGAKRKSKQQAEHFKQAVILISWFDILVVPNSRSRQAGRQRQGKNYVYQKTSGVLIEGIPDSSTNRWLPQELQAAHKQMVYLISLNTNEHVTASQVIRTTNHSIVTVLKGNNLQQAYYCLK